MVTCRSFSLVLAALTGLNAAAQQSPADAPRPLSEQLNQRMPKWLHFGGEFRLRPEGFTGGRFRENDSDLYLLNRLRINMRIQPAEWMKLVFQGQDARVFGKNQSPPAPPFQATMDLRIAYMELGDAEKKPFCLRVGRQELALGEERLVGRFDWSNTARSFDAVRVRLSSQGYRLDAFASSVVNVRDGEFDKRRPGDNLHGLYGGMEKLVPGATVEPYVLWRLAPGWRTESGAAGKLDFKTVGVRWVGKLPRNLEYGMEVAGQVGSLGTDQIRAWAGHLQLVHTLAATRFQPRLIGEYNYASGDRRPGDGKRGTFDSLYPTPHGRYGLADQVGWQNIHNAHGGVELKLHSKWRLAGNYHSYWLASPRDGLYNPLGAITARVPDGSAGRHVGHELDVMAVYAYSSHVQVGAGYGHLFPGAFLKKATPGKSFGYPYWMLSYRF